MGRKLSFCKEEALGKAVRLFGARGYEKTCMRDVAHKIDVPVASLYHTFGDKSALLSAALESYFENNVKPTAAAVGAAERPRAAITDFFMQMIAECADGKDGNCLMLRAASELGQDVPDAAKSAKRMMGYVRDQFTRAVAHGQAAGDITIKHDAEFLSAYLIGQLIAIKTWLRMGAGTQQLQTYITEALEILAPR